jgi:cytochrome oxidase Cu insertion factor (SCO1/SenC/PrrC family)
MFRKPMLFCLFALLLTVLAACAPAAKTPDAMMEKPQGDQMMAEPTNTLMAKSDDTMMQPTEVMMEHATITPTTGSMDTMMEPTDAMMQPTDGRMHTTPTLGTDAMGTSIPSTGMDTVMPAKWFDVSFINPADGKMFKINDFKGKVVLVETFAQWCTTCLAQQKEVVKLHEMLGMNSDLVTISLDVDPNENADGLKAYLAKYGQDWNFAIAPVEVSREISQLYGDQFLNPPSAPMLVIDRKGEAHPLPFGIKSADSLQKALEPFLKEGM